MNKYIHLQKPMAVPVQFALIDWEKTAIRDTCVLTITQDIMQKVHLPALVTRHSKSEKCLNMT